MSEEVKEIIDYIDDRVIPNEKWDKLKVYITNLQKRKITKEDVEKYFEENMCVSFEKFLENWEEQQDLTKYLLKENETLKEQKKKAIEYIKEKTTHYTSYLAPEPKEVPKLELQREAYDKFLKILGGDE